MVSHHEYSVDIVWTGNRGTGTSGYRSYGRDLRVSAVDKHEIAGSADRTFHGDADRWNPEELFLTALAQCHMLSYFHAAVSAGVVVTGYRDTPVGTLIVNPDGSGSVREVTLRPHVTLARGSDRGAARKAHDEAHRLCFIANSVSVPVTIEPEFADEQ
ncbi:OsmC family protein [Paramicrobacterium agarici]|uniref:Organic hydroperoxide reductase OsmC/OhrA n=1 Tax=Paramicrobacterium agarici TaxID=630514 RepID=A0A2A9DX78_9MICO|nr:OsmC family protein [Microbacterium agarici]PFG30951.1 organic hydroperoxide reductase OsmC/OhrA [Microbacterium agarici]